MFETIFLFAAIFVLEIILEIDNFTALRQAAEGLPDTPLCQGQNPHLLALGVRVGLAFLLFNSVYYFSQYSAKGGLACLEQLGGVMIIFMAAGLIINYMHGGKGGSTNSSTAGRNARANGKGRGGSSTKKTNLVSFLVADAFLSLDTVVAAVAMTTNFNLAMTAMISAAVCIMIFHQPLQAWLKLNPRMALIAFVVIALLGANLILTSVGVQIPKYFLLGFVFLGVWLDGINKDRQKGRDAQAARDKKRNTAATPLASRGAPKTGKERQKQWDDMLAAEALAAANVIGPMTEAAKPGTAVPKSEKSGSKSLGAILNAANAVQSRKNALEPTAANAVQSRKNAPEPTAANAVQSRMNAPEPTAASAVQSRKNTPEPVTAKAPAGPGEYVFGTSHGAAVAIGQSGFVNLGQATGSQCAGCGNSLAAGANVCNLCGRYQFFGSGQSV